MSSFVSTFLPHSSVQGSAICLSLPSEQNIICSRLKLLSLVLTLKYRDLDDVAPTRKVYVSGIGVWYQYFFMSTVQRCSTDSGLK